MKREPIYILTGASRGIGRAVAQQVSDRGHRLYTICRGTEAKSHLRWDLNCDLNHPNQITETMACIIDHMKHLSDNYNEIILINNAGILTPIAPLDTITGPQMANHLQVNLLAPAQLMAIFIKGTSYFSGKRRILNISSGAGRHPYAGWSLYCASKAALDMMTRCAVLEQQCRSNAVAISAVAPGMVATDMQVQIRQTQDDYFPDRKRFVQAYESGQLQSPETVAVLLLDLDGRGQFDNGGLYDLRDVGWNDGFPAISPRLE